MQRIIPNIWCQGTADEAAAFYEKAFAAAPGGATIVEVERYPEQGLLDFQQKLAGKTLTVELEIAGLRIILINAGNEISVNPAISFMLNFDPSVDSQASENLATTWAALQDGGQTQMELGEYPFSKLYGWVEDRFGVNWQLILTDPKGEPRPPLIPTFLFGAQAQNLAAPAQQHWIEIFPDSAQGTQVAYQEQTGPARPEALMFSEFRLAGQWFVAMDSGVEQKESFSPGVSLMFEAVDQEEIDQIWHKLSAVPEAEQCGWLADKFGVSWQIVPANLAELMERPDAFEKLMEMKKIVIADF